MANRKHSKIDNLPEDLKAVVEQMLQSDATYAEIVQFLADNEQKVSVASVCRYARAFNANMEALKLTHQNFKMIKDEIDRNPDLDMAEAIIRITSGNVFNRLANTQEEDWDEVELSKLIKETNALIRATAYKKRVDIQNQEVKDSAIEEFKSLLFSTMAKEKPALYKELVSYLNKKKKKDWRDRHVVCTAGKGWTGTVHLQTAQGSRIHDTFPKRAEKYTYKRSMETEGIYPVSELCIRGNGLQSRGLLQNNSDRRRSEVSRRPTLSILSFILGRNVDEDFRQ